MSTDTHIHLQALRMTQREACLRQKARRYWCQSIAPEDWPALGAWSRRYSSVKSALGIHPWFLHRYEDRLLEWMKRLEYWLKDNPQAGVGEIGLDFYPQVKSSPDRQQVALAMQLALAQSLGRPCSVHIRKAFSEAWRSLRDHDATRAPVVLHGFGGGASWARRFVALGCSIGVNGVIVRDNARRYHEMVKALPLESIMLETDGPYVRLPGRSAFECTDLDRIARKVAELKACSVEHVLAQCERNAKLVWDKLS